MRITTLELENFRCFEQMKLELHPEFTLLVGINGSGKTAVLEALALFVSSWFVGMGLDLPRKLSSNDIRRIKQLRGGIPSLIEVRPTLVRATCRILDSTRSDYVAELDDGLPEPPPAFLTVSNEAELATAARLLRNRRAHHREGDLPVLAYYSTARLWHAPASDRLAPTGLADGYQGSMDGSASYQDLRAWMAWRESVKLQEIGRAVENNLPITSVREPLLDAVANAALACLEGATRFYYSVNHQELRIDFADGRTLPFNLLSDGTRNLLALAGDIAWRAARLNPHHGADAAKKATGVVLIDEIDLHLHPTWQRRVIPDLRRAFPGIQFVATTHSPQVLSTAKPEWIRILHADGRVETVTHTLGRDSNSLLEDVFEVSERPEKTRAEIAALFDLIDRGALDEAEAKWAMLHEQLGPDDPDLVRAQTMLDLEKMPLLPDGDG